MKRVLSIIVILMLCFNVKAQTSLTTAVDFNVTDDHGTNVHLFDILDNGQFALLYFFFHDASSSPQFDPCIAEAYYHYGENLEDVYFIGVAPSSDSLGIDGWKQEYQVDFPVVHKFTSGTSVHTICDNYGVKIFATLVLVAPNRKIVIDNIWPIESSQQIIAAVDEAIATADDEPYEPKVPAAPVIDVYAESPNMIVIEWEKIADATSYTVYRDGEELGDVTGNTVEVEVYPETTYCFTVTASNSFGESAHSNEDCATTPSEDGLEDIVLNDFSIYPNPASSTIDINSAVNGEAEVNIFDMTGRCVKNVHITDMSKATINVSDIDKGVYFVNVNGIVKKLVIE